MTAVTDDMQRPLKHYTLVLLSSSAGDGPVSWLLGYKKRGFGAGKWNGFGGKVEPGETVVQAAIREMKEECGVALPTDGLTKIGQLHFEFSDKPVAMFVHVFTAHRRNARALYEPVETEEMLPRWFEKDEIPYNEMWADDEYWWPYMIRNERFYGYFRYDDNEKILGYTIDKCDRFDNF